MTKKTVAWFPADRVSGGNGPNAGPTRTGV